MSRLSTTALAISLVAFLIAASFALIAAGWFMINFLLNAMPIVALPSRM